MVDWHSNQSFKGILKELHINIVINFSSYLMLLLCHLWHQGLFPCSCSSAKKNSINKIRLHRWGMSCCYGNPLLEAADTRESDQTLLGEWQIDRALVTVGNPEWVSWPGSICTIRLEHGRLSVLHVMGRNEEKNICRTCSFTAYALQMCKFQGTVGCQISQMTMQMYFFCVSDTHITFP